MYCTRCGTKLDEGARYCSQCGSTTSPAAVPPPLPEAPLRRLRRITGKKKIAGVCAGFAEYFDTDVTLMRLIWVGLLILPPAIGLIAYIIAWIVLPAEFE